MAIVKNIAEANQTPSAQKRVIDYCQQPSKTVSTENVLYVSGINCIPELAHESFLATQKLFDHESGTPRFYQYVQSFSPNEKVTPELAHKIALEFAEQFGNREILVATHLDREHLHTHFVFNAYDLDTGIKYTSNKFHLAKLREESDRICLKYGLSVLNPYNPKQKSMNLNTREYRSAIKGNSWKLKLCADIDECMKYARSKKDFQWLMKEKGYGMTWTDERKYITYIVPNGNRVRDIKLHEAKYLKEMMEHEFRIRQALYGPFEETEQHTHRTRNSDRTDQPSRVGAAEETAFRERKLDQGDEANHPRTDRNVEKGDPQDRIGERETGWESERESLGVYLSQSDSRRSHVVAETHPLRSAADPAPSMGRLLRGAGYAGSLFVEGEETEEERKRREAQGNGSLIGAAVGVAVGAMLTNQNDETNDNDEDEEYDSFPKMTM